MRLGVHRDCDPNRPCLVHGTNIPWISIAVIRGGDNLEDCGLVYRLAELCRSARKADQFRIGSTERTNGALRWVRHDMMMRPNGPGTKFEEEV